MSFGLLIGLALCAIVWPVYLYGRGLVRKARHYTPPEPLESLKVLDNEQRVILMERAIAGGFWFATVFAVVSLVVDLVFFFTGSLPTFLLIWVAVRTILLPVAGYLLGRLGGYAALRRSLAAKTAEGSNGSNTPNRAGSAMNIRRRLAALSTARAQEEAKD